MSKGKVGYPWEITRDLYPHIPPIFGLYNGCIGQYGVIFWEQLLVYPPKGTQFFPLMMHESTIKRNHLVKALMYLQTERKGAPF